MVSQNGSTPGSTIIEGSSYEYWDPRLDQQQQSTITSNSSSSSSRPLENGIDAWHNLADPSAQVRAGGIGTGSLHRKGKNFKPVDEELLFQQELTDTKLHGGMRMIAKNRPPSTPAEFVPAGSTQQQQQQQPQQRTPTHMRVEDLTHRPPTSGGWGSGKLSTVPFWEQRQPFEKNTATTTTINTTTTTINIPLSTVSSTLVSPSFVYDPQPPLPSSKPLLEFVVALAPGVSITFTMHEGDEASAVTERMVTKHHLNVAPESKQKITKTLQLLYEAKIKEDIGN